MKYRVIVKPNSRKGPLVEPQPDGTLLVYVKQPATEGKANLALIEILADYLGVAKNSLRVVRGVSSRHKTVEEI